MENDNNNSNILVINNNNSGASILTNSNEIPENSMPQNNYNKAMFEQIADLFIYITQFKATLPNTNSIKTMILGHHFDPKLFDLMDRLDFN